MDTRSRGKAIRMSILAAIASIAACFALIPGAYAAEPSPVINEVSAHQVTGNGAEVRGEFRLRMVFRYGSSTTGIPE